MFRICLVFLLFTIQITGYCQDDAKYKKRADEVRKEIWDADLPAFKLTKIPDSMNNESAVIIARSFETISTASEKMKMGVHLQTVTMKTTTRQRVKVNDKSALTSFSSLEYIKESDNTTSFLFSRFYDKTETYIGAKIIKADGTETFVNTDEEVLTENKKKYKEGKLAISGLHTGDILDYYIRTEDIFDYSSGTLGPYTFFLADEYPVLNFSVKFQLNNKMAVEYVKANNAPAFQRGVNDNNDIVLELSQANLPKFRNELWVSKYRNYPYVKLQFKFQTDYQNSQTYIAKGEVREDAVAADLVKNYIKTLQGPVKSSNFSLIKIVEDYFGGAEKMKDIPKDSVAKMLYNSWRYKFVSSYSGQDAEILNNIKYAYAGSLSNAVNFSKMLTSLDIDNTVYLVCSRFSASLKDVLSMKDFSGLVKINTGAQYWVSFDDLFTQFQEIPAYLQGEYAITLTPEKTDNYIRYTTGSGKVPVTIPAYNSASENISVNFDSADLQLLHLDRISKQTGALRHYNQKLLLLTEDIDACLAAKTNQKKLLERLNDDKKSMKFSDGYNAMFTKERGNMLAHFTSEINNQFGSQPKEVTAYKILQHALFDYSTPFEYKTTFSIENFVKKAGTNYIFEVGRLEGNYKKIDEKEHNRTIDVYMPCARTYNWDININIPKGYKVKGVDELNKVLSNETGSFTCTASNDDATVKIKMSLVYAHNFEKAEKWPQLLELNDAFYYFSTQKLLLEKNK